MSLLHTILTLWSCSSWRQSLLWLMVKEVIISTVTMTSLNHMHAYMDFFHMLIFTTLQIFKSLKMRLVFVCHCPLLERRSEPLDLVFVRSLRATTTVGGSHFSVNHLSTTEAYKYEGLDGQCPSEDFFFPASSNNWSYNLLSAVCWHRQNDD